jgi:hypothetical protein
MLRYALAVIFAMPLVAMLNTRAARSEANPCPTGGENLVGVEYVLNHPGNSPVRDSVGIAHLVGETPPCARPSHS